MLLVNFAIIMAKGVVKMDIGTKIKNAREDLDISQREMAAQIPMNQSNYSKIERNMQEPNLEQLRQICLILHLDPSYLLSLDRYEQFTARDMALLKDTKALIEKYKGTDL